MTESEIIRLIGDRKQIRKIPEASLADGTLKHGFPVFETESPESEIPEMPDDESSPATDIEDISGAEKSGQFTSEDGAIVEKTVIFPPPEPQMMAGHIALEIRKIIKFGRILGALIHFLAF